MSKKEKTKIDGKEKSAPAKKNSGKNKKMTPERKKRLLKRLKITGIVAGSVLLALVLANFIAAFVTVHIWTHPEKVTWDFNDTPASVGLDYYSFSVETENGTVRGWKMAAQTPIDADAEEWVETTEYSDKTIILAPNYDSNRQLLQDTGGMDYYADWCQAGYNVIVFDWTGSGYSDGKKNAFTLDKTEELQAVVEFAAEETGASYIAVQSFGFSCYPAAQVAARSELVDALILDSCYETFSQAFFGNLESWTWLTFSPVKDTIRWIFPLLSGVDADSASLVPAMTEMSGKDVFFIQGGSDEQFGTEGAEALYNVALTDNNASIWIPSGVLHLRARSYDEDDYFSRITEFLNSAYDEDHTA